MGYKYEQSLNLWHMYRDAGFSDWNSAQNVAENVWDNIWDEVHHSGLFSTLL